jgi:ZIP family zinc transporter
MGFESLLAGIPLVKLGVVASVLASVGVGAGALPVLAVPEISRRTQNLLLAASAGVMLAATFFSLLAPGLDIATQRSGHVLGTAILGSGILLGALAVLLIHRFAPHEHFSAADEARLRSAWLFAIAVTLHHFPEGLAVGVGFGGGDVKNGVALTAAIFFQNLPEGFIVAMALIAQGTSRGRAFLAASATGLAQLFGGLVGAVAVTLAAATLPWAMGFAAGAMLFVINHELLAQTHREAQGTEVTVSLLVGFVGMMMVEAVLH